MQKIKRVLTVTTLKKGDETVDVIGNFSIKSAMRSGYSILPPRLVECEMDVETFYKNATVKREQAEQTEE